MRFIMQLLRPVYCRAWRSRAAVAMLALASLVGSFTGTARVVFASCGYDCTNNFPSYCLPIVTSHLGLFAEMCEDYDGDGISHCVNASQNWYYMRFGTNCQYACWFHGTCYGPGSAVQPLSVCS